MTISPEQAKRILAFSARIDQLERMRETKRITNREYIHRINDLRVEVGLLPLQTEGSPCRK